MLEHIQGCLLGVAVGDALGVPVEMMTPEEILQKTYGKGITGFNHSLQRKDLSTGSTSDDWGLTAAILQSLIRRQCFDLTDIALSHVEAYENSTSGWGGTTRSGIEELAQYFESRGKLGRSPFIAPPISRMSYKGRGAARGLGNGVAMKIAPLAIYAALTQPKLTEPKVVRLFNNNLAFEFPELAEQVALVGALTHADPRAWSSAYAVALIIAEMLMFPSTRKIEEAHVKWMLARLITKVAIFESTYIFESEDSFAGRLDKLLNDFGLLFGSVENLRAKIGTGCLCLESVCFAIAIFFRHPMDFKAGALEAVNSGGDADTIASLVGAMIGSVIGTDGIPTEWIRFNSEFQKSLIMGSDLIQALK